MGSSLEILKIGVVKAIRRVLGKDPSSSDSYGPNWDSQRKKCLERDFYECRVCGKTNSEMSREPAVHHITPRRNFREGDWKSMNSISNLITLCHSCHGKLEGKFCAENPDGFAKKGKEKVL